MTSYPKKRCPITPCTQPGQGPNDHLPIIQVRCPYQRQQYLNKLSADPILIGGPHGLGRLLHSFVWASRDWEDGRTLATAQKENPPLLFVQGSTNGAIGVVQIKTERANLVSIASRFPRHKESEENRAPHLFRHFQFRVRFHRKTSDQNCPHIYFVQWTPTFLPRLEVMHCNGTNTTASALQIFWRMAIGPVVDRWTLLSYSHLKRQKSFSCRWPHVAEACCGVPEPPLPNPLMPQVWKHYGNNSKVAQHFLW